MKRGVLLSVTVVGHFIFLLTSDVQSLIVTRHPQHGRTTGLLGNSRIKYPTLQYPTRISCLDSVEFRAGKSEFLLQSRSQKFRSKIISALNHMKKAVRFSTAVFIILLSLLIPPRRSIAASGSSFSGSSFSSSSSSRSNQRSSSSTKSSTSTHSSRSHSSASVNFFPTSSSSARQYSIPASNSARGSVSSTAMVGPAVKGASVLAVVVATPWMLSNLKGKLGLDAAAVYEIQMAYRLNNKELKSFLIAVQRSLESGQNEPLSSRVEKLCINLLRKNDCLLGGGMVKYQEPIMRLNAMKELFHSISVKERVKFDDDGDYPVNKAQDTSVMVLTIVLLTVGPVLRNKGWSSAVRKGRPLLSFGSDVNTVAAHEGVRRTNLLKPQHIERLLYGLPPYLKSLDNLQTKHIRRMQEADEDDVRNGGEQPGFDVDILWTPSTADSLLTDGELKLKWPSIQYF